jgi:hypothetical protein
MSAELQAHPAADCKQTLIDLLTAAQERETELETLYLDGRATTAQLVELEQVRIEIEDTRSVLDDMGYSSPS